MTLSVVFDVRFTYYYPQYEPVIDELVQRGALCQILLHPGVNPAVAKQAKERWGIDCINVADEDEAADYVIESKPHWFILGHATHSQSRITRPTQTALIFHGLDASFKDATKRPELGKFDVRFLSGRGRSTLLKQQMPEVEYVETGFAKLDPLMPPGKVSRDPQFLTERGLNPGKPTLLYAPTFYPSSLENVPKQFPREFDEYNILIKAHDFTLHKKRYRHQLKKLKHWEKADNVYLAGEEEFSLLPFMAQADLMISDTSSAVYEFAALNKPVIICGFIYLRWSYRGPFRKKALKRMDSSTLHFQKLAAKAEKYHELKRLVDRHIESPDLLAAERTAISEEVVGPRDGLCASRIADYLEKNR